LKSRVAARFSTSAFAATLRAGMGVFSSPTACMSCDASFCFNAEISAVDSAGFAEMTPCPVRNTSGVLKYSISSPQSFDRLEVSILRGSIVVNSFSRV